VNEALPPVENSFTIRTTSNHLAGADCAYHYL